MTRYAPLALILALCLVFVAPWPLPALLTLLVAPVIPVAPVALGLLFDTLYKTPGLFPLATLLGALASLVALIVRRRLSPGIIT